MAMSRLQVGMIGANANYGWSPRAHLPALLALPEFEVAAVCTAHEETAKEATEKFDVSLAFHDHREMLRHPEIDVVAVSVRVPLHYRLTMDALEADKHVFTEWPLGANLQEAEEMAALAQRKGVHTMVGLQARCSPPHLRLKELIDQGYVGDVLSCRLTQFGTGPLTRTSDRTWQRDRAQGATTLTIAFGHAIDALCMCLGEFSEVAALVCTRVPQWYESDTGRMVDVTAPDNILVSGTLMSGAAVSAHVASVPWHGSGYSMEVYGRGGALVLTGQQSAQIGGLHLMGGRNGHSDLEELPVPERLTWVPESVLQGPAFNVAQMWSRFADGIRSGKSVEPDFDMAVTRHRLLDAVQRASDTGQRQSV